MWFHSIPMEDLESNDVQFQRRRQGIMHCSSSEMNTNPNPMPEKISGMSIGTVSRYKSSIGSSGEAFFSSGWDSFVNLGQRENFGSFISHDELSSSYQHNMLENPHSFDSTYVEMVPKFPSFSSGNFSEMGSSFVLPQYLQIVNDDCVSNIQENRAAGSSPDDKSRKRGPDTASSFRSYEKVEMDLGKDSNGESYDGLREQDQRKPKIDDNNGGNLLNKPTVKQAKDNSPKAETSKENYIHVRARRGEATNSHSLAERIRREKISERMKLLQELVPGCNKITGKAVMLDEIINYVQSLQQQVEFLSMKLATVNPEIYTDIEGILSKDMLHSQGSNGEILGVGSSQRFFPPRMLPPQTAFSQFLPLSRVSLGSSNEAITATFPSSAALTENKFQTVLQNEFQIHFQMGLDSG